MTAANPSAIVILRYWGSHFKSSRHAALLAEELSPIRERGWRCHLILDRLPDDTRWLTAFLQIGVDVACEPRPRSNFDWWAARRVYGLCRRTRATVFHCENMHTSPLMGAFCAGVPARIWTKRAMNTRFEECLAPTWRDRLAPSTRLSCLLATQVIAVSMAVKDELLKMGAPEHKVTVRHNPRKLGTRPSFPDRTAVRRGWGFSDSEVVIVTVGHAVPVKGWDILLRAFASLSAAEPRARLVLVGSLTSELEQSFFPSLARLVEEHNLQDKVVFTGHLSEVRPTLCAADLYVSPSRSEGFSNALIEALDAGLPCVATQVGIAAEVVLPGRNGLLVKRADVLALHAALLKIVRDDALRGRLATHAQVPSTIPTVREYGERIAEDYRRFQLGKVQGRRWG